MILCEHGPGGRPALFDGAQELIVAAQARDIAPALARLDAARARGRWVAGYLGYEAGHAFEPRLAGLMPGRAAGPLLAFGIYAGPLDAGPMLAQAAVEARGIGLEPLHPMISRADYGAAFERVMRYIGAGDCYQINLTFPIETRLTAGSALGLYGALRARQAVGFGAFVDLGGGGRCWSHARPNCSCVWMRAGGSRPGR